MFASSVCKDFPIESISGIVQLSLSLVRTSSTQWTRARLSAVGDAHAHEGMFLDFGAGQQPKNRIMTGMDRFQGPKWSNAQLRTVQGWALSLHA